MTEKPRSALSLPGIEEFSKMLRTMFINIGFFAATLLLIPSVASQFTRTAIVIDPIAVPEAMVAQGLTPEVVANRIWDGLQEFAATASANREAIAAIPDSQLIEFSLPDAGVSIDSIFAQLRQFFQIYETRIGGEYVCATPACEPAGIQLRLRVVKQHSDIVDLPAMGAMSEREYYRQAAAGIYEIIDPYVAIAAQAEDAPLKAATLARGLILEGSKDAKWAHNLVGDIELRDGDAQTAIVEYQSALAIDPDFHVARAGLARALLNAGDAAAARAALDELERRSPSNPLVPRTRADVELVDNNVDGAIAQLLKATELDPLQPGHLSAAGSLELDRGNVDQGVAYLQAALEIDPGFGGALDRLAQAQWDKGDKAAAEALYRQWLDFEPDNMTARSQLGIVLFATEKYREAFEQLDLAYRAGIRTSGVPELRAIALAKQQRYEEAIEALVPLAEGAPDFWPVAGILADSYEQTGQRQRAAEVYERYLAASAADAPERASAEQRLAKLRERPL